MVSSAHKLIQEYSAIYADYLGDESRLVGWADAIAFPRSSDDLVSILSSTNYAKYTIQGARTGIAGGAVPQGGCLINLQRMNRIKGLNYYPESNTFSLLVEPGVLLSQIRKAVSELDFNSDDYSPASLAALEKLTQAPVQFFPPDPTEDSASIGGMAASNASGALSFKYGPTRNHIRKLRLILPDGDSLTLQRGEIRAQGRHFELETNGRRSICGQLPNYKPPPVKNVAGYYLQDGMDMLDLFIGAEGELGIISELEIDLSPLPSARWGICAFLPSEQVAIDLTRILRGNKPNSPHSLPAAIEFFDADTLNLLRRASRQASAFAELPHIPNDAHNALYLEYHGTPEQLEETLMATIDTMTDLGADPEIAWLADNQVELDRMKQFRHAAPEAVNLLIDERRRRNPALIKLGTDLAVPDDYLEWIMQTYRHDLAEAGLESIIFGHMGDNHLHVNIIPRDESDYSLGKELHLNWAKKVVKAGGSISAEHGTGRLKTDFIRLMYGQNGADQMQVLRKLFDPRERLS